MAAKTEARDANRRIAFDEAGRGVYLVLRNSGIRELHTEYGRDHVRIVNDAFLTADIPVLEKLLDLMAHKGEERFDVTFDDIENMSLQNLSDKLRDAWSLAIHGLTFEGQIAKIQKLMAESEGKKEEPDPLPESPADGLDTSSEQPSGQD